MILQRTALTLFGFLTLAACSASGQDAKRFSELEGSWTITTMEADGKSLLKEGEGWKIIVKNGKATSNAQNARKKAIDLATVLDSSKEPKTITFPYEGNITFYGIYEVKGDELRICGDGVDTATEKNPEARRPKKFDSKKGLLLVFKRN